MSIRNLDQLFDPASVAVFGASQRPASVGATVWANLRGAGFKGPLYAVNPKHRELDGQPVYARAADLPSVPELAVICTPPATVAGLIRELGALGTRAGRRVPAARRDDSSHGSEVTTGERFVRLLRFVAGVALGLICWVASAATGDIGVFTAAPRAFATASYWIEGTNGLVLIDTQFLPTDGLAAVQEAERASGKRVLAAIVLHPNPDKFNGTAVLQQRGIRVITSGQVRQHIPAVHRIRLGWFFDDYAPDYPRDAAQPDEFGVSTTQVTIAGLALTLHVLGAGASAAHVVVQHGDAVFVGDLVNPANHAWLELGLIGPWLARLDDISALSPKRVFPGRGASGGAELIERQAGYLRTVRQWVRDESPSGELGWLTKLRLTQKIERAYPELGYAIFMRDGLGAVWRTEAAARAPSND